jgi:hypothetical protein
VPRAGFEEQLLQGRFHGSFGDIEAGGDLFVAVAFGQFVPACLAVFGGDRLNQRLDATLINPRFTGHDFVNSLNQ